MFKKYGKVFILGVQNSLEYRTNFLLSLLSIIFPAVMQYFFWTAVFKCSSSATIYGYTHSQMIFYSLISALMAKLVASGFEYEVNDDIKNGGLNKFIVKPIGYMFYRISCFLGEKSIQAVIIIVLIGFVTVLYKILFDLNIALINIIFFLVSMIFAIILNFLISFCVSTIAFLVDEVSYLFAMSAMFLNIISGGVLPVDVFPSVVQDIFKFLPFRYTIYSVVNIVSGRMSNIQSIEVLVLQIIWILIMSVVSNLLWKSGVKKYTAAGG